MNIVFTHLHPASSSKALNSEYFVLRNDGDQPFSTRNCVLEFSRKGSKKTTALGTMEPGITIAPGESVRVVTGNPGRKAHGAMPSEDQMRNYSLFLAAPVFKGKGSVLTLRLRSMQVARAELDPATDNGLAAEA